MKSNSDSKRIVFYFRLIAITPFDIRKHIYKSIFNGKTNKKFNLKYRSFSWNTYTGGLYDVGV